MLREVAFNITLLAQGVFQHSFFGDCVLVLGVRVRVRVRVSVSFRVRVKFRFRSSVTIRCFK